jgi:hypothetical protein
MFPLNLMHIARCSVTLHLGLLCGLTCYVGTYKSTPFGVLFHLLPFTTFEDP